MDSSVPFQGQRELAKNISGRGIRTLVPVSASVLDSTIVPSLRTRQRSRRRNAAARMRAEERMP